MTALHPGLPDSPEAPSTKWTSERVAFITEQYLIFRKSGGEIARMLGPAFTRNRSRKALQDRRFEGEKRPRPWPGSRLAERQQFRQPKVQVPEKAGDAKASRVPADQSIEAFLSLSQAARNSSKRPKLSLRSTVLRSSTLKQASAVGPQIRRW